MTTSLIFACLAFVFFVFLLYFLDLILFVFCEKKRFESASLAEHVLFLEQKQKKARHLQKKNYYLYLVCLALCANGEKEKALRLAPFLKNDPILGISKTDFQ